MNIHRIGFNQPAVVILGAGVTRGASFVEKLVGVLPPLDSDFFTQAQRLSQEKPKQLVDKLVKNAVGIFGKNFKLTMEGFLTHLEQLSHVFEDYKLKGWQSPNPYPGMRTQFLQVLAAVLDEAIGREPQCHYHQRLVESLSRGDTILSFNYDWLIDQALRAYGKKKWNPRIGYGVDVYVQGNKGKGTEYWAYRNTNSGNREYPPGSITLLKMHGAMNWFPVSPDQQSPRLKLRQRWWHQKGDLQFEIAPPEWNKPIRSGIYQSVWRRARSALKRVRALVVMGYSLPETDLPAQALLMVDAVKKQAAHPLELLIIVNPDQGARRRIRQILWGRIDHKTRILSFDFFKQFSDFLAE